MDTDQNTAADTTAPAAPSGVLARLQAHRETRTGDETLILPETGVVVTFPTFKPYHLWQRAQRLGGKDADRMQLHYIIALCRFDGERLKLNDYAELIPADDHIAIVGRIFGGGDEPAGDDEGNAR